MFLHARIDVYEPRPTAFHTIETFGLPSLLAYPAIHRCLATPRLSASSSVVILLRNLFILILVANSQAL